jgi:hypothetical protein
MSRISGNLIVDGQVIPRLLSVPASSVGDAAVSAAAGIDASKLDHQHQQTYSQPNTAATAEVRVLHVVRGATATVLAVKAGSIAKAIGDSTVTIDVKKNGTTILSSTFVLDSSNSNYVAESGTVNVSAGVVGDVYTAHITISAGSGTLPTGVYVTIELREDAD